MVAQRHLFREQALQEYARSREREMLPHMVQPPVLLVCWLLLIVMLLAWQIQKVLQQARLPKWRGSFRWQIEALQAEYAKLRAESAKPDG